LISLASLLVLPSLAESFGFVVLEAMSLDKPVVAAATGGIPELISDGVNGILVAPGDPQALASALSRIIKDQELARALTSAGRISVQNFLFERMMHGYEAVYQTVRCSTKLARTDRLSANSKVPGNWAGSDYDRERGNRLRNSLEAGSDV
jgi:glycosyltransferase involved in cell wall biosynthesis